jgi:hypothetical protein
MKSFQRLVFSAGLFSVFFSLVAADRPAFADPMTGGNPPFEDCAPPCATSCYVPPPRCPWYFQADAVALRRETYGNISFASLGLAPPATVNPMHSVLSTTSLDPQFRAGAQLSFGHTFGDSPYSIEGSYLWMDNWDSTEDVRDQSGLGRLYSPFRNFGNPPLTGFDNNKVISIQERSWLQNGELNVKYLLPMPGNGFRASFLVGVRYMSIDETLEYQSFLQTNNTQLPSQMLKTWATNDLIGPQIGGYFEFFSYLPNSWVTFEIKGAICGNSATQMTWDSVTNLNVQSDRVVTAFVGDLALMFNWRIASHCVTRFGYQAMWVDGLAQAARNLGPAGTALEVGPVNSFGIDAVGETVYHGPHLGVEIVW